MRLYLPRTIAALLAGLALSAAVGGMADRAHADEAETTQTIVLIRHGEKPPGGLGQINCQGLNRALALPAVIRKQFGKPAAIFAPNPSEQKKDNGTFYDYVRPLATIEPTAIAFGLPIHSGIGQARIDDLRAQLDAPAYHDAFVLIAWEHWQIVQVARALMRHHGGDPSAVPDWQSADFDSIYVLRIRRTGHAETASFQLSQQGLDGQSTTCPGGM